MDKRSIVLMIFFLGFLLIIGCSKESTVNPGVSIVVVNDTALVNAPVPAETGQQDTEASQAPLNNVKEFSMIAKKFEFVPRTITVNKGDTVKLSIKSEDVNHGFAISEFNVKKDIPAGQEVSVEFVADKSGSFPFRCSVYCGSGHSDMDGTLVVN